MRLCSCWQSEGFRGISAPTASQAGLKGVKEFIQKKSRGGKVAGKAADANADGEAKDDVALDVVTHLVHLLAGKHSEGAEAMGGMTDLVKRLHRPIVRISHAQIVTSRLAVYPTDLHLASHATGPADSMAIVYLVRVWWCAVLVQVDTFESDPSAHDSSISFKEFVNYMDPEIRPDSAKDFFCALDKLAQPPNSCLRGLLLNDAGVMMGRLFSIVTEESVEEIEPVSTRLVDDEDDSGGSETAAAPKVPPPTALQCAFIAACKEQFRRQRVRAAATTSVGYHLLLACDRLSQLSLGSPAAGR